MPPDPPVTDLLRSLDPEWLPPHLLVDRDNGTVGAVSSVDVLEHLDDLIACYLATRSSLLAQAVRLLGGDLVRAEDAVLAAARAACRARPTARSPAWRVLALAVDQEIARRRDLSADEEPGGSTGTARSPR